MTTSTSNRLLDQLPPDYLASLLPRLREISLPMATNVYATGDVPKYAHFMTSGVMSIVTFMEDGRGVEVGLIGSEGLVEACHLLGPAGTPTNGFIQIAGSALRMPFEEMRREFQTCEPLRTVIHAAIQTQNYILAQLSACNRLHEVEERLARWLLMVQDRIQSDRFYLTQEFLAEMIGARRTTVTFAASNLQSRGLIEYSRGHIHIIDQDGMKRAACECYVVVRNLNGVISPPLPTEAVA